MRLFLAVLVTAVLGGAVGWLVVEDRNNRLVWDHFDVVKPGILYRSGQLRHEQLTEVIRRYRLRTVVNFQTPSPAVDREREICKGLGVDFLNLPMPGDGFGQEDQFREVLKAIDDIDRRPVLVHCARGTCRTGAAVALYRFERDGWTIEDVAAEMKRQTYRQGWLPGYVYNMVAKRPGGEMYEPHIVYDKNLPQHQPVPQTASEEHHHVAK